MWMWTRVESRNQPFRVRQWVWRCRYTLCTFPCGADALGRRLVSWGSGFVHQCVGVSATCACGWEYVCLRCGREHVHVDVETCFNKGVHVNTYVWM